MSEVKDDFQDIFEDAQEEQVEIVEEETATETPEEPETEAVETEQAEEAEQEPTTDSEPKEEIDPKWDKESWMFRQAMDEREKRQQKERELEDLRKKLESYDKPEAEESVSVFEDEKAFTQNIDQRIQTAARNAELNISEAVAKREFGGEKVAQATEWFKTKASLSPSAIERFQKSEDPYHELVTMFEDDLIYRDPEAYKARLRAEVAAEKSEKVPKPTTPSLASKRSAGNKSVTDDFEDLLKE